MPLLTAAAHPAQGQGFGRGGAGAAAAPPAIDKILIS
jgi:hypothetical protein